MPNFIKDDPQKYWNCIKERKEPVHKISLNNITLDDPQVVADHFNNHFHSVFSATAENRTSGSSLNSFDVDLVSYEGVLNMLLKLKAKSSPGPDGIPNAFLRRYAEPLAGFLVTIFQSSLKTSFIPHDWRTARVVPILKKGDPLSVLNYRPISIISSCCKLVEHIVATCITKFLDDNNILSPHQHGFRKGFSTVTQLASVVHFLASVLDTGGHVDMIFLDFSKAFDRVPHDKLIQKLYMIGLPEFLISWVSAYLNNRTQYVEINGKTSGTLTVSSGVPQGSVLGPLLFLIYINDLASVIKEPIKIGLFADDCVLFNDIHSIDDQLALNVAFSNILNWCNEWGMELNCDKTVLLRITKKHCPLKFSYSIGSQSVTEVSEYKYLGITLTNTLSWNTHIANICSAALRKLCFLRHKLKDSPSHVKRLAYEHIIRPKLEYGCIIWDPYTNVNINALEKIQRKAVRFIFALYGHQLSVTSVMASNQVLSLQSRRKDQRLKFLFSLLNRKLGLDPAPYLSPLGTRRTRHTHPLSITPFFARTNVFKFSFFPQTITDWNSLSPDQLLSITQSSASS